MRQFLPRWLGAIALLLALALPSALEAKGAAKGSGSKSSHPKAATPAKSRKTSVATSRTAKGKIKRSAAAKHRFEVQTGYPKGRPGYVIDHIVPLACGGADAAPNMQWQTIAEARAKDRIERRAC